MRPLTEAREKFLFALAVFGCVVPNGFFLYYFLVTPAPLHAALSNPVALVFTTKAFLRMGHPPLWITLTRLACIDAELARWISNQRVSFVATPPL